MRPRKHTPSPWTRKDRTIFGDAFDGSLRVICQVSGGSPEAADANACLIESAPDLLEALKDALAFLDRPDITTYEWYKLAPDHVGKFRRAIAKAEGR